MTKNFYDKCVSIKPILFESIKNFVFVEEQFIKYEEAMRQKKFLDIYTSSKMVLVTKANTGDKPNSGDNLKFEKN